MPEFPLQASGPLLLFPEGSILTSLGALPSSGSSERMGVGGRGVEVETLVGSAPEEMVFPRSLSPREGLSKLRGAGS